jgi:predicted aspartyl protease
MTVTGIDSGLTTTLDALVDTDATHSMVPADVLANLGVTPVWRSRIRMANESVIDLLRGEAEAGALDRKATAPVLFGPEGSRPILGATTLEILELAVDPIIGRLMPSEALLMLFGNGDLP